MVVIPKRGDSRHISLRKKSQSFNPSESTHSFSEPVGGWKRVLNTISENHLRNRNSSKNRTSSLSAGSFIFSHPNRTIILNAVLILLIIISVFMLTKPTGITGMITIDQTETKELGLVFNETGEILLSLEHSPVQITLTGKHTGKTKIKINEEEFYSGNGTKEFVHTKNNSWNRNLTIKIEPENSSLTLETLDYVYQTEIQEQEPAWNSNKTSFEINKGEKIEINLDEYFTDDDNLTYLASGASNITVQVHQNMLAIIPDPDFSGERRINVIASDDYFVVQQELKIKVLALEINESINITETSNITETNQTLNITKINQTLANITETNQTLNITKINQTLTNITKQKFKEKEKIKIKEKTIGKKLKDEQAYEVYFTNMTYTNSSFVLEFYHNLNIALPVFVDRNVSYNLSSTVAHPNKTVVLTVDLIEGILPKFELHVGMTSEVFEFGKTIPTVKKKKGKHRLIDRDDEFLDVEITDDTARVLIQKTNASEINTALDTTAESIIKTKIFAAEHIEMQNATITLAKNGRVNSIVKCEDINLETLECNSGWNAINTPFIDDGENITFIVDSFSGYAGAEINVINIQSYPTVGGNWTVKFNTTGTANLTIRASNDTTWSLDGNGTDLQFLEIKCGDAVLNYSWTNDSVFIENYNCSSFGYETSKVLTSGKHTIEFKFGDDITYAFNEAAFLGVEWTAKYSSWWTAEGGGYAKDNFYSVDTDSENNVIAAGYTKGTPDLTNDAIVAKYNKYGLQIWNATFAYDSVDERFQGVAVDSSDNIIAVGYTEHGAQPTDYIIVKYNSDGVYQWNKTVSISTSNDLLWDVAIDNQDNIIAGGYLYDSNNDVLLLKYNSAGTHQWSNYFKVGSGNDYGRGVAVDNKRNVYVVGETYDGTDPNYHIHKFDENGTHQWNTTFNADAGHNDYGKDVITDSSNNAIMTGYSSDDTSYEIHTRAYNATGTLIWNITFDPTT
ncbi:hypothetical protein GF358_01055, partial [Candidatus Woesearchaeota archaeon]|nr:hypothetical protein [Candidatus Woesearchaeota archaeon]